MPVPGKQAGDATTFEFAVPVRRDARIDIVLVHDRLVTALTGADADDFFDRVDENHSIADIAGARAR
jgi:hypothetical protein